MEEDFSGLKSLVEMAVEYLNLLVDSTKDVVDAQRETAKAQRETNEEIKKNTKATLDLTKAKTKEKEETNFTTVALKGLKGIVKSAALEFVNIGKAGIEFGQAIGVSATKGVQLEIANRKAVASQLSNFNIDLAVTIEQLKSAQQGFTDTFIGAAAGMQISAEGSRQFAEDLKKGFGSEFKATPDTFRMMIEMGMSNVQQMSAFRNATGRAGLTAGQLSVLYNQNRLSFLLYGNSFAKAAVEAQRLGVNLASVQAAQEGLVTNLDGTIDTVAQINQLGGQIDFGNLIRVAEKEGPDALLAYVRRTVPEQLMQSASTRSLFKQLGISVEDYMKSGNKQTSAAAQIEAKMTDAATATDAAAKAAAGVARADQLLEDSFGQLKNAAFAAAGSLLSLAGSSVFRAIKGGGGAGGAGGAVTGGATTTTAMTTRAKMMSGAKIGAGVGAVSGLVSGVMEYQQSGSVKQAVIRGLANLAGTVAGGALGSLIPIPGVGTYLGATAGAWLSNYLVDKVFKADDMMSGYGSRALVTPTGTYALNNADDIIAGTNLFAKGSLNVGGGANTPDRSTSELVTKMNELIGVLRNSSTVINIDNKIQEVPRYALAGVYTRNERR